MGGLIETAAAHFAVGLATGPIIDRRKQQRLDDAYRNAASETIEYCRRNGYSERSAIWKAVTDLLRTETRAQQIASWYAGQTIDVTEFRDMTGNEPIVGQFLQHFISLLNKHRTDLLPLNLQILADIILTSITQMGRQLEEIGDNVGTILQVVKGATSFPSISYWLGRPSTIGDGFVGREADLKAIGKAFEDRRVVVISGGAGSGKSRLAAEYAHRSAMQGFWTTAGRRDVEYPTTGMGPDHPDTLASRHNLASAYYGMGRNQDAVQIWEETLPIIERVLGSNHRDTLQIRNSLGRGYWFIRRFADAIQIWEETLRISQEVFGAEHPDTLQIRSSLADGYSASGRIQEAVQLDEETLSIRQRVLGLEHPDTINCRRNLALAYRELGRDTEADELDMS